MIGFVVSKQTEALSILGDINNKKQTLIAGKVTIEGTIGLNKVVIIISGTGKVNAAIATQAIIDHYPKLQLIINYGTATAISKKLNLGMCYFVKRIIQSDFNLSCNNSEMGLIEDYDNAMHIISNKYSKIITDEEKTINLATQDTPPSKDMIAKLKEQNVYCYDMEGAACLQVCKTNRKPLVCLKAINGRLGDNLAITDKCNNIAISNLQGEIQALLEAF